jgi:hypothetical protein
MIEGPNIVRRICIERWVELAFLFQSAPEKIEDSKVLFEEKCFKKFQTLIRGLVDFVERISISFGMPEELEKLNNCSPVSQRT